MHYTLTSPAPEATQEAPNPVGSVIYSGSSAPVYDDEREEWNTPLVTVFDPTKAYVAEQISTVMTPNQFKGIFTIEERLAINAGRSYTGDNEILKELAAGLEIIFSDLDDIRLKTVDLSDPRVAAGLQLLEHAGLITAERAAEIGLGVTTRL